MTRSPPPPGGCRPRTSLTTGREKTNDRATLSSITTPTLVIAGRHDFICGPRWAREINDLIADSKLVILEDSGHFGHVDAPARFAQNVVDFVRSTPA
jgi:pimeloyl-ACP methyl ester carboxylesterase